MRIYKRGRVWHCTFYDERGARVRRTTNCEDRKAAEARAREWERRAADPDHAAASGETLSAAIAVFFRYLSEEVKAGRRSPATRSSYETKAGHLIRIFEYDEHARYHPRSLAGFNVEDVRRYIAQRRGEDVSDGTIAKELVPLRLALRLSREAGRWRGDPSAVIPVGFAPKYCPRQRSLAREELDALMAALPAAQGAMVAFMVATGAEWAAVRRARRSDAHRDSTAVLLRGTKRASRHREVPIASDFQRKLLRFAVTHANGERDAMFRPWSNVGRDLAAACGRAGIARCSPNDLRRTFASWMVQAEVAPLTVAYMMGHRDASMVERVYGRLRPVDIAAQVQAAFSAGFRQPAAIALFSGPENRQLGVV